MLGSSVLSPYPWLIGLCLEFGGLMIA